MNRINEIADTGSFWKKSAKKYFFKFKVKTEIKDSKLLNPGIASKFKKSQSSNDLLDATKNLNNKKQTKSHNSSEINISIDIDNEGKIGCISIESETKADVSSNPTLLNLISSSELNPNNLISSDSIQEMTILTKSNTSSKKNNPSDLISSNENEKKLDCISIDSQKVADAPENTTCRNLISSFHSKLNDNSESKNLGNLIYTKMGQNIYIFSHFV
jgi:hypothetical protein